MEKEVEIQKKLLFWYDTNRRDLPWRKTKDPYMIWVSEIMLQQTRVDTVLRYYDRFVRTFPDVVFLAEADEQEVLKLWEGLGYYRRAKALHAGAKEIVRNHDGILPASFETLQGIRGIGRYTAGAIASIAYGQPVPAVDGNAVRVFSRLIRFTSYVDGRRGKSDVGNREKTGRSAAARGFQSEYHGSGQCGVQKRHAGM